MKKQRKSEEKHVGTSGGTRMELRVARVMFAEYLLFEIQRDVNILLYIEPERQSEKVFPSKMREALRFLRSFKICLLLTGLVSPLKEKRGCWKTTMLSLCNYIMLSWNRLNKVILFVNHCSKYYIWLRFLILLYCKLKYIRNKIFLDSQFLGF